MNKDKERGGDHEEQREVEREKEKKPMEPHLPVLPRCPPQVKFSARLEEDPDHIRQLAYLAQVSDEARKAGKAWRRALHELDLATLEVKAAQQRHELAETLRKRAHAGVLGIDTSTGAEVDQGAAA
ncbi:hypothetical protein ID866_4537 [Astraeus odoratus]|nr:hypothetical protein ID866_4537 [Astraeus odoratus]